MARPAQPAQGTFSGDISEGAGNAITGAPGYSEMLKSLCPASRSGDKSMKVDPRAPSTGADTVIGGR